MCVYNPLDKFYKSTIGAVKENSPLTFRVKGEFCSCVLAVRKDGEDMATLYPMDCLGDFFEKEVSFSCGLYWYKFIVGDNSFIGLDGNYLGIVTDCPREFQLLVYSSDYVVPEWLNGGIIYQIFPDRFYRAGNNKVSSDKVMHQNWLDMPIFMLNENGKILNNDFFGGDLKGVEAKLPYLKELNVSAIYLNPIFKAYSNHRYDTGNYLEIDELLGTEKDFDNLIESANKFGIKIILDGVFNHTGDDSIYFNKYGKYNSLGAYQSKDSPYYNWYMFNDFPNEYSSWWGITVLPALDKNNPSYIDFITGKNGVIEKYILKGIGGFRLDVVDELPDTFVKKIRDAVKRNNKDAIVIGEVWEDATNKISYGVRREYFLGGELDSVMNYPLKDAIIKYALSGVAEDLAYTVKEQIDHFPFNALNSLMNIMATHDTYRLLSALGGQDTFGKNKSELSTMFLDESQYNKAKNRLKIAVLLQYLLYGVPSVYYGDERGMQGYSDPLNRKTIDWAKVDIDIFNWYKMLGSIRSSYDVFTDGEYKEIYAKNGIFGFIRCKNDSDVAIIVNMNKEPKQVDFSGKLTDLISGKEYKDKIIIESQGICVLVNKN